MVFRGDLEGKEVLIKEDDGEEILLS